MTQQQTTPSPLQVQARRTASCDNSKRLCTRWKKQRTAADISTGVVLRQGLLLYCACNPVVIQDPGKAQGVAAATHQHPA